MGNQEAHPVNQFRRIPADLFQQCPRVSRSFLFLQLSIAETVFFLRRMNANVMENSSDFQNLLLFRGQVFHFPDHGGKHIHFQKMLDTACIAFVKQNHPAYYFSMFHLLPSPHHIPFNVSIIYRALGRYSYCLLSGKTMAVR